jgi:hypothetical protein
MKIITFFFLKIKYEMNKEFLRQKTLKISAVNKKITNEDKIGFCELKLNNVFDKIEKNSNHEVIDWYDLFAELSE